jgi:branched-subunit amino acid aminotransferase/4-amino-4-deoxychorismate lyase
MPSGRRTRSCAMKAWLWNGDDFATADAIPLTDRGFRYGMAVFESLRIAGAEPQFFEQHHARLAGACAERDFSVDARALAAAQELLRAAQTDGFARIYVTAGDGPPAGAASSPRVVVILEPRDPPADDVYEVTICEDPYRAPFGGLKTANYWFNADALAAARRRKFDEALLFNDLAELVSACCANVFLVHGERIATPARSSGARGGVIREWVIARRRVEERRLRRADVLSADEIFLTNSWFGVMPVATVEGRPLGPRRVGPRLASELADRTGE